MAKVFITKEFTFEASHQLLGYDGNCSRMHGHSYKLQVTVKGNVYPNEAIKDEVSDFMVMDFKDLKNLVKKKIIKTHDHCCLNDLYDNPTAEAMSISIYDTISRALPLEVSLDSVRLWETADSFAEYRGD